jgi:hypothetical protein
MKKFLLSFILCGVLNGLGQNAIQEYKKVLGSQKKSDYLTLNIDVLAYETKTDKTPEVVGKGILKRDKTISYSKYNEFETLYGEKYTLVVNHETRSIDYYMHEKNKQPKISNDYMQMIDSTLIDLKDDFQYFGVKDDQKHFAVTTPEDVIERTDFYFNSKDNLLAKVVYGYGPSTEDYEPGIALAIISYKNYSFTKPQINDKSYYVTQQGNSLVAANNYKGYKVNVYKE